MIRLLHLIWFGHCHKWEPVEKREIEIREYSITGMRYIVRCTYCGTVRKFDCI